MAGFFYRFLAKWSGGEKVSGVPEREIYSAIGDDGFRRLVQAFYRQVAQDDVIGPMYPREDLVGAEERLREFLVYRFGGPQTYLENRGHPRLRIRHAPFLIGHRARDRWVELMSNALDEVALPADAVATMKPFFEQVATFLMNR